MASLADEGVEGLPAAWQRTHRMGGARWMAHLAYCVLRRHAQGVTMRGTWPPLLASLYVDVANG
eukprot:4668107-Lingulodinium_polyedra.AAC.1